MNKPEKPTTQTKARETASAKKNESAAGGKKASTGAVETLTDITNRSTNLFHLYAEKLRADSYQVIEPKTVTGTFQEFAQKVVTDPTPIIKEQVAFWTDLGLLWQRTALRTMFNIPAEPVIAPAKQDKRFKNEAWTDNWFFDYTKQHDMLLSR